MSRRLFYVLCLSLIAGGVACGDDDDDNGDAGSDGAVPMPGPSKDASTGGGGSGGSTTVGGSGGMGGDAGDVYECVPPAPEAGGDAKKGDACCDGLGVCADDSEGTGTSLDVCAAGKHLTCAPIVSGDSDAGDDEDGGAAGPVESCRVELPAMLGDFDLEGRCVPSCFVAGDASATNLGQSSCDKGSKCVPCYSPITGESTGACEAGGDHPAEGAPEGFTACGDGDAGYCVAAATAAAGAGMAMLPQLTCGDDEVCVPRIKVIDQKACFAHCDSMIGGPGACIAAFIVPEMTRALLQKSSCEDGEVCAPCVSPIDKMSTGACR